MNRSQVFEAHMVPLWRYVVRSLAAALLALGFAVLLGWALHIDALKSIRPGRVAMNPATALAFCATAVSIWLVTQPLSRSVQKCAQVLPLFVVVLAGLRLFGYLTPWDPGIDRVMFASQLGAGAGRNYMAPHTAVAFVLSALGVLLVLRRSDRSAVAGIVLAVCVAVLAALALVGQSNGVVSLFGVSAAIGMAIHTSGGFLLLSAAVVLLAWSRLAGSAREEDGPRQHEDRLIAAGFAVATGAIIVVGITASASIRQFLKDNERAQHAQEVLSTRAHLGFGLKDAQSSMRGFVVTGDEAFLTPYSGSVDDVTKRLVQLRDLTVDSASQQTRIQAAVPLVQAYLEQSQSIIDIRRLAGFEAARDGISQREGLRLMADIMGLLEAIEADEHQLLRERSAAADESASATVVVVSAGSMLSVCVVGASALLIRRDARRRRIAEQDRAESERSLRFAVAAADIGTWAWDLRSDQVAMSERAGELLGGTASRTEAQAYRDALHPDDRERVMAAAQTAIQSRGEYDIEYRCIMPDQSVRWVAAKGRVREDDNGNPATFQGVVLDITDRKESELAKRAGLERDRAVAEASNRAKSEFLAHMSHEIRTPLNGVVGMTDLLLGTDLTDTQRRFARLAKASAEGLTTVINDILDFSKIEAGKLELVEGEFSLRQAVEDIIEVMAPRAAAKRIEIACCVEACVPSRVCGDPDRLRQILVNLINNAVKFTERGGVVVRAEVEDSDTNTCLIRFSVRDTGIGVPSDRMSRLFKAFSQAEASTTRFYGGTGLGLVISKRLSELMGGQIGVESAPGKGSTFWFTVRFRACPQPVAEARPIDMRGMRILAVDDNEVQRCTLMQQIASWGLEAAGADDGASALRILNEAMQTGLPFRLAMVDRDMPGMDGLELAKAIRREADIRETVLMILLTADDQIDLAQIRSAGFSGHVTKPVRQSQLFNAIMDAIAAADSDTATARNLALPKPQSATVVSDAPAPNGPLILLAEDNEVNQIVATEVLRRFGCRCDTVCDGQAAVDAVSRRHYDLLLVDCQMPRMDGFEATRQIRGREAEGGRRMPIIALTANAMQGDRERCLEAGMDGYVSKPIDPKELLHAIKQVMGSWIPPGEATGAAA